MSVHTDKKTGRLYIEFQHKNARYKERLPAGTTRADAEKIEIRAKNDMMFQSHGIETRLVITFRHFIQDYYGHVLEKFPKDRQDRTILIIKAAYRFIRDKPLRSIKAADIERFKASRVNLLTMHGTVRKPATVEREMSIISSIFSMAVKNDLIDYNPCSRVERLQFDNTQDKILRREDEDKFFAKMKSEWAKDICKMVLNTGLRQNDLMQLTRFQVDLSNALITLVQGKTRRKVYVPLNDEALEILRGRWEKRTSLLFPSPVTGTEKGSVRHAMMRACNRAEIPVITIRDLRRTFATRALEDGADFITIADILGHTGLRMLPRYVRSLEMKRKLVNSIPRSTKLKAVK